jgi:hypothetical protein
LLAEGELTPKRSAAMQKHIESCWQCKADLTILQETITAFIEYRRLCVLPAMPPRPTATARLERRVRDLNRKLQPEKKAVGYGRPLFQAGFFPKFTACGTAVAVGILALRSIDAPVVSANEVINKSIAAEQAPATVHQKIRIRYGSETATRELWRDRSAKPIGPQVSPIANRKSNVETALVDAGWSATDPLSARTFAHWRNSLKMKTDSVQTSGPYLQLSTSTEEGEIAKAELTIRKSDFHALTETLHLRHMPPVIELEELDFDRDVALPQVHEQVVVQRPVLVASVHKRVDLPPAHEVTGPDQDEMEANARVVLHRLNADFGQPIEVKRDAENHVFLEALDMEPGKLDQIHQLLPTMPIVTTPSSSTDIAQKPVELISSSSGMALGKIPILEQTLPDPQARTDFGNAALEISHNALLHAYALRNLDGQYPVSRWGKLTPALQHDLEDIRRDQLSVVRQSINRLNDQLTPILIGQESATPPRTSLSIETLLNRVQEVDSLTNILFAGAGTTLSADETLSRMRQSLSAAIIALNDSSETIQR